MSVQAINWESGPEQQHANPLVVVHRLLRGKYLWAIGLAAVFGVTGALLGYSAKEPTYRATGVIRIQPSLPKVLYESEQNNAPTMFSSFVSTQAELILTGGVIELARSGPLWGEASRAPELNGTSVAPIQRRLNIDTNPRAQEIIRVSFTHEDPGVSAAVVRAILDAYIAKYSREGSIRKPEIIKALEQRRTSLLNERRATVSKIDEIVSRHRTENLEPKIQTAISAVNQLQEQRAEIQAQLDIYEAFRAQRERSSAEKLTPEQAADLDPRIGAWLADRSALEQNRMEMMVSEGLREEHRDVRRITQMIEGLDQQIADRMRELGEAGTDVPLFGEGGVPLPSEQTLGARLARIEQRLDTAKSTSDELFSDNLAIQTLRDEQASIERSLAQVNDRLDMIETESLVEDMDDVGGKISVAATPNAPTEPTSDPRFRMAAAGFVGLGSLPVLALLGVGYFSHRVQYSDDDILGGAGAGIVGMLPDLGDSLVDQELATASAFAVHQIRSQLQIKNKGDESRVYGVTSPAPGDGKTSLIIAMGLSFAESGNRTLLVDLDFIGRGLSIHFGYPQAPSLAESLTQPAELDSLIRETEFGGLELLPAGLGDDERVSRLSPRTVGAMVEHIRGKYDTVLIDSGPILGSVEAAFLAPNADGMVMVVGRGQYKPLVRKAIDQIHAVDGKILATIFNRASVHELRESSSSMSVHFSRQVSRQKQQVAERPGLRVGPVAGTLFRPRPGGEGVTSSESGKS